MNIAIEQNTNLVYEASSTHGHPVWPSPMLFQVVITSEDESEFKFSDSSIQNCNSYLFREDTYNSASRVRRGRLYKSGNSQPNQWQLYPHPALATEVQDAVNNGGTIRKSVYAFHSVRLSPQLRALNIKTPIFLLGTKDGFTIWTLVNTETSATGDEIITLKARMSIGALPKIDRTKVLAADGQSVIESLDKLEEEVFRAGPDSVVDCAREAATAILSKYLQDKGESKPGKDLGALAKKAEHNNLEIIANAAKILARLHSRRKHAEQEKREFRNITEQDAEFSVQAVGLILCELGWGAW